ncbi:MAG: proprotein convertase P-domain-containing protein [Saprospiraceae bacterium]|nr:proprotein convertase P-domain-containing protein [Saprospiraceae bacterium]
MFRKFTTTLLLLLAVVGAAQAQALWSEIAEEKIPLFGERRIVPQTYRTVRLDPTALQPLLTAAPERFTAAAAKTSDQPIISIPMPNGKASRFRLTESPVMAPELQAKFPEIRTYTGHGIDDPTALLKCDWTPHGFHAMVISPLHSTVFVDPYSHGDTEHYTVYFKKDYLPQKNDAPFVCETPDEDWQEITLNESSAKLQGDCQLRRYRLALACTGEYAIFHGGTTQLALAAMNTTMNRVNGVYENDFAITMQIIANNNLIVYLNPSTDPYTNGNASTMLGQNQTNITNVIGAANYDIGHVFGTNSGGVANLGVVCNNNNKARGVTGSGAPIGDPFDIDYVAHEMGHQFGGSHTFNGTASSCSGNGSAASAMEPGSGSTVMAYAGICGAHNVQANSDDYFHARSIQQIGTFAVTGTGNNCPVKINTGNNNPSVNAGPDYIIPKSTPFALTATGSDPDGDALTYCWEQIDAALGTTNPPAATNATGPMFRSFKPVASPTRWFPRLTDLVSNTNYAWERLPGVARTLTFRVVLRDNNPNGGCTAEDDAVLTVTDAAGPFLVTEPNTNVVWYVGETKTVTWDVANTNAAPVNCANVRILLSTDGGFNYPIVLAASAPNTGSANVTVPDNLSNTCRVKVEAIGNIFFDISNQNFRIELPPSPTFSLSTSANTLQACAGETASFTANVASILGFDDPVNLVVTGAPAGASVTIAPNPATPPGVATIAIDNITPDMAGNYTLTLEATSGPIVQSADVLLSILPGAPAGALANSPSDGSSGLPLNVNLEWDAVPFAQSYIVEVATNPSFEIGAIVQLAMLNNAGLQTTTLQSGTVYYWRLKTTNDCGESEYSPVYAFQTGNLTCGQVFSSTDVPKTIDANSINTAISALNVVSDKAIADVDVAMVASHTYVGDLDARLVSPTNDTTVLFDRPGVPATQFGCSGDNLALIFNDNAPQTAAQLESMCNTIPPALSGEFQPITPLAVVNGKDAQGEWQLLVRDNFADDGGSIVAWSLTFCFAEEVPTGVLSSNNPLSVPAGGNGVINEAHLSISLSGDEEQGKFVLLSLPQHGALSLNGAPLGIGGSFTQADINAGLVVYTHSGDAATSDAFQFDAIDLNDFAWVHNATFNIIIIQNDLAATLAQTQAILCHNDANGQITVSASGLDGQYLYSLNGGPNQSSNVFSGLAAGNYTVVVTGQFGFTATTNSVVLNNPLPLTASNNVVDAQITVNATGGTGALEYSLDGDDYQPSNVFEDMANGVYTIIVRDANGCTTTTQAIVAVNTLLATLSVQTPISCFGGNNGVIAVTIGGGQAPFEYSLNGGPSQPENIFSGLAAGDYTVVVSDSEGFTASTNLLTLTNPSAITASANANLNTITVTAAGGTGQLQYSLDGTLFQSANTFGNLPNGDYTVTVRDANGCTATTQVTVDVPALDIVALNPNTGILCFGAATGTLEVLATGGIPPYQYALNGGAFHSSNVFTNLGVGPHVVVVRDAIGNEVVSQEFVFPQPPALVVTVEVDGNDADIMISGGTPPYTYTFNGPVPPVNLPNGTYNLTATDANGCTATTSFTIDVPPLAATVEVVGTDPCAPSVTIEVTATGGEGPYEYSLNNEPFQSSNVFTIFSGQNTVRVRDVTGTIIQVPVTVTFPTPVEVTAVATGDTIVASGAFGNPPYQYSLDGVAFQMSNIFPNLPNGTYTVTVKDAAGCTNTVEVEINVIGTVEPSAVWGLVVSPNPSTGLFRVAMEHAPATLRAELFDAAGRRVRTLDFNPGAGGAFSTLLDLQDAPQGIYLLRLTDGVQWGSVRLSVMR